MNIVNDHYLQDSQVLAEAVDFLKEIIFAPIFKRANLRRKPSNGKRELESVLGKYCGG